jgi:hypothetical protein
VLDQEDADAVVGSPRGKQHISLVKCRVHHNTSKNDQADAELPSSGGRAAAHNVDSIFKLGVIQSRLTCNDLFDSGSPDCVLQ